MGASNRERPGNADLPIGRCYELANPEIGVPGADD